VRSCDQPGGTLILSSRRRQMRSGPTSLEEWQIANALSDKATQVRCPCSRQLGNWRLDWRGAKKWVDIDRSVIGHSPRGVEIAGTDHRANIAALLHPSFGVATKVVECKNMALPMTEVEIVRAATT
jgi:hypothetical protein